MTVMEKCKFCSKEFPSRGSKMYCSRPCKEKSHKKRNYKFSRARGVYDDIRYRCNTPSAKMYKYYGAKGIKCKFKNYKSFEKFYLEHTNCQTCDHSFDEQRNGKKVYKSVHRINNDGNYCESNLMVICTSCHSRIHLVERKRGLQNLFKTYANYLKLRGLI